MSRSSVLKIDPKQTPPAEAESEAVVTMEPLKVALKELTAGYERMRNAREDYKSLVDAVAEKSKLKPAVIRSYINARMSEHGQRRIEQALQLVLVFDRVGI
jgi:hypothetical protein